MIRCPFAIWKPAVHHGYTVNGQRRLLVPSGVCAHSADSSLAAEPIARFFDPFTTSPGSTHFWISGDGKLWQMVELDEPAWGNGNDYRTPSGYQNNMPNSPIALVRDLFERKANPNWESISLEFTGTGSSRGVVQRLTTAQLDTWARLMDWLKTEGIVTVTKDNLFFHQHVVATACPDGRFTTTELLSHLQVPTPEPINYESRIKTLEETLADITAILVGNGADGLDGKLLTGSAALKHARERGFSAILSGQRAHQRIGELALIVSELSKNPTQNTREALIELLKDMIEAVE